MLEKRKRYINSLALIIIQITVITFVIRFFIIEPGAVDGPSMEPMFNDSEIFLVNKLTYMHSPLRRFDVVQAVVNGNNGKIAIIKRVVGLPGEIVTVEKGKIFVETVEGKKFPLDEPYLKYGTLTKVRYGAPNKFYIPSDYYFLVGDNRGQSVDSRDTGPVHRKQINGKVIQL